MSRYLKSLLKQFDSPSNPFQSAYQATAEQVMQLQFIGHHLMLDPDNEKKIKDLKKLFDILGAKHKEKIEEYNNHFSFIYGGISNNLWTPRQQHPSMIYPIVELLCQYLDNDKGALSYIHEISSKSEEAHYNRAGGHIRYELMAKIIPEIIEVNELNINPLKNRFNYKHWEIYQGIYNSRYFIEKFDEFDSLETEEVVIDGLRDALKLYGLLPGSPDLLTMLNQPKICKGSIIQKLTEIDEQHSKFTRFALSKIELQFAHQTCEWIRGVYAYLLPKHGYYIEPDWTLKSIPKKSRFDNDKVQIELELWKLKYFVETGNLNSAFDALKETILEALNSDTNESTHQLLTMDPVILHNAEREVMSKDLETYKQWWLRNRTLIKRKDQVIGLQKGLTLHDYNKGFISNSPTNYHTTHLTIEASANETRKLLKKTNSKTQRDGLDCGSIKKEYYRQKKIIETQIIERVKDQQRTNAIEPFQFSRYISPPLWY